MKTLLITLLLAPLAALHAADFYVATNGSDANPDTKAKPFGTLAHARDQARKIKQAGPLTTPVTIFVRGGTYFLNEPLVFTPEDTGDSHLRTSQRGERPAVICNDVKRLVIDGLDASSAGGAASAVRLAGCPGASIRNSGDVPLDPRAAEKPKYD